MVIPYPLSLPLLCNLPSLILPTRGCLCVLGMHRGREISSPKQRHVTRSPDNLSLPKTTTTRLAPLAFSYNLEPNCRSTARSNMGQSSPPTGRKMLAPHSPRGPVLGFRRVLVPVFSHPTGARRTSVSIRGRWQRPCRGSPSRSWPRRGRAGRRGWEHLGGLGWRGGWCGFAGRGTSCLSGGIVCKLLDLE